MPGGRAAILLASAGIIGWSGDRDDGRRPRAIALEMPDFGLAAARENGGAGGERARAVGRRGGAMVH